jgi:hypothetical protein
MAVMASWPTVTDDDGTGQTGTVLDLAFFNLVKASIEDQVHSTTNAEKPKAITDEVVTARGNMTDLNDRLDGVIDADGNLITPATIVSASQLQSTIGGKNLAMDPMCEFWHESLTAAPTYWNSLTNATITIAGTGQTDTTRKFGDYCIALTWTSGTGSLTQTHVPTGSAFVRADVMKGETMKFGFGMWVKTSIASHARVQLTDGDSTTSSSYHTGGGAWEWLSGVHTVSAAATKLESVIQIASAGTAYYSGLTVVSGDFAPDRALYNDMQYGTIFFPFTGTPATGDGKAHYIFQQPAIVTDIQAYSITAPTTGGIDLDIEKWATGSVWDSVMGAAKVDFIATAEQFGNELPSATAAEYHHRCFAGAVVASGTTEPLDALIRLNLDAIEDAVDLNVMIRCKQIVDPWAGVLEYDEL